MKQKVILSGSIRVEVRLHGVWKMYTKKQIECLGLSQEETVALEETLEAFAKGKRRAKTAHNTGEEVCSSPSN